MKDGIGSRAKRREDPRFLTGSGAYIDDLIEFGMLYAAIVRSPHAHARILSIDASAAAGLAGFARCITAADVGTMTPIPVRIGPDPSFAPHLQRPLATDVARYVGEPVAIVLADTPRGAEDAAELIQVDYEPLTPVIDAMAAQSSGKIVAHWTVGFGDTDSAFKTADCIVRERFTVHRQTALPLEPRGLLAKFDAGRRMLTMWGPTKVPYFNRAVLSSMIGLPESQIHFIEPDVGGGFGARGEFYPEDFLVPFAAMATGRPVKWIETRREHFLSINHSRGQTWEIALAGRRDGTLIGMDATVLQDLGAYMRTHGTVVPTLSAAHLPGPYRLASYRCAVTCVTTNRTPMATMRGPGLFECNLARERALDTLAHELGLDPREIRRRNLVTIDQMPYDAGTEIAGMRTLYDSGDFIKVFNDTLEFADPGPAASSDRSAKRLSGFGMATIAEPSGWGPFESARVEVDTSGTIRVYTGATSQGQGQETTLAQVCGEILDVPIEDISVVHGDTRLMRFGVGTYASRAAVTAGSAVFKAAWIVRERALDLASKHLEASPEDLVLEGGSVRIVGVPHRSVTLGQLARMAMPGPRHAGRGDTTEEGLSALAYFEVSDETCGFSVHTAQVTIDTETGEVWVDRYVVAADVGRAINPMIVEGQLIGGAVQGISGALREELVYDASGQLLTGTLMDYSLPTAQDVGRIDAIVVEGIPAPSNPLGVKGVGEAGMSGAGAAIANAVADALRSLGVQITELPLTRERIWRAIAEAKGRA